MIKQKLNFETKLIKYKFLLMNYYRILNIKIFIIINKNKY